MKQCSYISRICVTVVMLTTSCAFAQTDKVESLFEYSTATNIGADEELAPNNGSLARRNQQAPAMYSIELNAKASALSVGDTLQFQLPSGVLLNISITQKKFAQNGDAQIMGDYEGGGIAVITFGKDTTFANLSSADHSYGISIDSNQQQLLVDHKSSSFGIDLSGDIRVAPDFEPMQHLNQTRSSSTNTGQKILSNGKYEVTLLAVYSPEFAQAFNSALSRINQMIAFTNDAYERSGVNIELVLAHAREVPFNNGANAGTLLTRVTNGTNGFTGVGAIRNEYYADLVAVLPFRSSNSIGGIAWVNGFSPNTAFSVTQFAVWGSDAVFAHEIGHNLGSGHERISVNPNQSDPCDGGYTGYACGHGNGSQGTIMSYLDDLAWGYVFSNPALNCNGEPCGIASGQTNAADNKTSFNITAPLVTNFRIDDSNDDDKDGVDNDDDNCPNVINSNQRNTDDDSLGDACDQDDDNDGVNDPIDNCQLIANNDQQDTDDNSVGDACQNDGICFPVKVGKNKYSTVCF